VAFAWLQYQLKTRKREKEGSSWLLGTNFGSPAIFEEAVVKSETALSEEEPEVETLGQIPAADEMVSEKVAETNLGEADELEEILEAAETAEADELAQVEKALQVAATSQVAAMPVGPIDEPVRASADELDEPIAEASMAGKEESAFQDTVPEEPEIVIPEEDGLPRDWALYQQQASRKSWGYWLGGFGGRAFLFLSLLIFSLWMATAGGWGLRVVLLGLVALLVHELGHAAVMCVRRSWDWSQFLIPIPRAMTAKQWPIQGGWWELLTVLAGPLPGLIVGWAIFANAYLGNVSSDFLLDAALAAVVVNSVTLLPFLPLDGGRLLDLAFLRRMPQLRIFGLILAGLLLVVLAFWGRGIPAAIFALLLWAGIPAARRRSKLLPWLRANAKEDDDQQVVTAFNISRERSQRKAFQGPFGIARLDELMGLGKAQSLGLLGGVLVLGILALTWASPLFLPAYSLASNGMQWFEEQEKMQAKSKEYLGALRPLTVTSSNGQKQEELAHEDAKADLESWQERLAKNPSQPEKVFAQSIDLNAARTMKWRFAAHWVAEKPQSRQVVAREAVRALRREAIRGADNGNGMQAFRDLSMALRVIIECEPRHSLEEWVAWLELEREVLKEVEDVSSRYQLDDTFVKWYEGALAQCPQPTPRKVAGLILAESKGFQTLMSQLNLRGIVPDTNEGGPGRKVLTALAGVGELVSVEALQERERLAKSFAESPSLAEAGDLLEVEESLQRIESIYSFRRIAMSALKVKRVGIRGAAQELAQLREEHGYTARLDETNERRSLRFSRPSPSGEVVEMEWLLKQ
jgi:hypothetical protein